MDFDARDKDRALMQRGQTLNLIKTFLAERPFCLTDTDVFLRKHCTYCWR